MNLDEHDGERVDDGSEEDTGACEQGIATRNFELVGEHQADTDDTEDDAEDLHHAQALVRYEKVRVHHAEKRHDRVEDRGEAGRDVDLRPENESVLQ